MESEDRWFSILTKVQHRVESRFSYEVTLTLYNPASLEMVVRHIYQRTFHVSDHKIETILHNDCVANFLPKILEHIDKFKVSFRYSKHIKYTPPLKEWSEEWSREVSKFK